MTVTNKICPFREKGYCDSYCQLYVDKKCAFAIIATELKETNSIERKRIKDDKAKPED